MLPTKEKIKLVQTRFPGRRQSFEVTADHKLNVVVKAPFKEENWTTPLRDIDPSPTRVRRTDLKPLMLVVPLGLVALSALTFAVAAFWAGKEWFPIFAVALVFGTITSFFIWSIFKNSLNVLTFTGAGGFRMPLWFNNPTEKEFNAFVDAFRQAIVAAQTLKAEDQTLAGEIQKLKDLHDRGVLTKEQFDSAVNRLTGNENGKRLGF